MASSKRSKFCKQCFLDRARRDGCKSSGNTTTSEVKRANSRRGAIRRSAKRALVIKKDWLKKILKGKKTWELRNARTNVRGLIHLAESKAGGKLKGRANLTDCIELHKDDFHKHYKKHLVPDLETLNYKKIFAWVM